MRQTDENRTRQSVFVYDCRYTRMIVCVCVITIIVNYRCAREKLREWHVASGWLVVVFASRSRVAQTDQRRTVHWSRVAKVPVWRVKCESSCQSARSRHARLSRHLTAGWRVISRYECRNRHVNCPFVPFPIFPIVFHVQSDIFDSTITAVNLNSNQMYLTLFIFIDSTRSSTRTLDDKTIANKFHLNSSIQLSYVRL